jgi:hypothetical protein
VELILVLLVATCLIGLTIRAFNEADRAALGLQPYRGLTFEQKSLLWRPLREEAAEKGSKSPTAPMESVVQTDAVTQPTKTPDGTEPAQR